MRVFLVFLLFTLSGMIIIPEVSGQAGKDKVEVTVRLKNNDELNGYMFLENVPEFITIYTSVSDSLKVPVIMIRNMEITPVTGINRKKRSKISYYNNVSMGILTGRTNSDLPYRAMISAEMVHGIKFNHFIWPGIGFAYDQYSNVSVLPFFLSLRGDILNQTFTPIYFIDMGTGPGWDNNGQINSDQDINAGITYHLGTGFRFYSNERINVYFSVGYKSQKVKFTDNWDVSQRITHRTYKSMSFMIGIGI